MLREGVGRTAERGAWVERDGLRTAGELGYRVLDGGVRTVVGLLRRTFACRAAPETEGVLSRALVRGMALFPTFERGAVVLRADVGALRVAAPEVERTAPEEVGRRAWPVVGTA